MLTFHTRYELPFVRALNYFYDRYAVIYVDGEELGSYTVSQEGNYKVLLGRSKHKKEISGDKVVVVLVDIG